MINICAVEIPKYIEEDTYRCLVELLPVHRIQRINRYVNLEDSYRSLTGDLLMRFIFSKELFLKNEDIKYIYNQYGKPFLENDKTFSFNISHSGRWVVCAYGRCSIGIDIEKINSIDLNLFSTFLSLKELKNLKSVKPEHQTNYFYSLWTLKESYTKALGTGLTIPLQQYSINNITSGDIKIEKDGIIQPYFFRQYDSLDNYKLSVCAKDNYLPKKICILEFEEIIKTHAFSSIKLK